MPSNWEMQGYGTPIYVSSGYPFKIVTHDAGTSIVATVVAFVPLLDGSFPMPALGPVQLPVRLTPDATRPPAWGARREVVPLTAAVAYRESLHLLALSAPRRGSPSPTDGLAFLKGKG